MKKDRDFLKQLVQPKYARQIFCCELMADDLLPGLMYENNFLKVSQSCWHF